MVLAISWALLWRLHTSSDVTDSSVNIRRATTRQEYEGQVQSLARAAHVSRFRRSFFPTNSPRNDVLECWLMDRKCVDGYDTKTATYNHECYCDRYTYYSLHDPDCYPGSLTTRVLCYLQGNPFVRPA